MRKKIRSFGPVLGWNDYSIAGSGSLVKQALRRVNRTISSMRFQQLKRFIYLGRIHGAKAALMRAAATICANHSQIRHIFTE